MVYDKNVNALDMWMWGLFHNKSGVIASWEKVWTNNCVQMNKALYNKATYLFSQLVRIWELFCRSFRVVETHFFFASTRLLSVKAFFPSGGKGKYFWTNPSFRLLERDFFSSSNRLLYLRVFFLLAETTTDMSGNQFFKTELILADGN